MNGLECVMTRAKKEPSPENITRMITATFNVLAKAIKEHTEAKCDLLEAETHLEMLIADQWAAEEGVPGKNAEDRANWLKRHFRSEYDEIANAKQVVHQTESDYKIAKSKVRALELLERIGNDR